jgi:hypothetical protein
VEAAKQYLKHTPGPAAEALAVKAYTARIEALQASGMHREALALARAACQLHTTPYGQRLLALALLVNGQMAEAYALIEHVLQAQQPPFPLPPGEG